MKKLAGVSLFLMVCLLFAFMVNVEVVVSQDATTTTNEDPDADKVVIPDSVPMTLAIQDTENILPETFRGIAAGSSGYNVYEDVKYNIGENSLAYADNPNGFAEGAEFTSDPNITWSTNLQDENGDFSPSEEPVNTNLATTNGTFSIPGTYQLCNHGSRQVSTLAGADDSAEGSQTVTSQQAIGLIAHDCTPPDLWIAFQETAGSRNNSQTEEELIVNMKNQIIISKAMPLPADEIVNDNLNYLFIEEGEANERNRKPWDKTSRVTAIGSLFNEDGAPRVDSATIKTNTLNQVDKTRRTVFQTTSEQQFKGIFVRRNVPFIFSAVATDNGDDRKTSAVDSYKVDAQIFTESGELVEKVNDAYIFRKPNYPLNEHKEQDVFTFKARAEDFSGNVTEIFLPLYVVDTHASFEGRSN